MVSYSINYYTQIALCFGEELFLVFSYILFTVAIGKYTPQRIDCR